MEQKIAVGDQRIYNAFDKKHIGHVITVQSTQHTGVVCSCECGANISMSHKSYLSFTKEKK